MDTRELQALGLARNIASLYSQFQDASISEADGEVILWQIRELQGEIDSHVEGRL